MNTIDIEYHWYDGFHSSKQPEAIRQQKIFAKPFLNKNDQTAQWIELLRTNLITRHSNISQLVDRYQNLPQLRLVRFSIVVPCVWFVAVQIPKATQVGSVGVGAGVAPGRRLWACWSCGRRLLLSGRTGWCCSGGWQTGCGQTPMANLNFNFSKNEGHKCLAVVWVRWGLGCFEFEMGWCPDYPENVCPAGQQVVVAAAAGRWCCALLTSWAGRGSGPPGSPSWGLQTRVCAVCTFAPAGWRATLPPHCLLAHAVVSTSLLPANVVAIAFSSQLIIGS